MKQRGGYRKTTATNLRNVFFKYYKISDNKSFAAVAGRCNCSRITDFFCSKCHSYICEKHLFTDEENYFCENCKTDKARVLTKKEIRKIRKAEFPNYNNF